MLNKFCPKWACILIYILVILILIGIILWLAVVVVSNIKSYAYIGRPAAERDTITISGEGRVTAIPDIATIRLGVVTEKKEVAEAQQENTSKMNSLIKELAKLNIEKKDIQTSSYNIYPRYDYRREGGSELRGYEVNQTVTIKIRDLDKVGAILAKAGQIGVNQIGGLEFTIDNKESLRGEARKKALANAKEKAEALAEISGVKLGKVVSFSESEGGNLNPRSKFAVKEMALGLGGGEVPEVRTGSMEVVIFATVSYEIK